jgi:hypothetical protein
MTSKSQESERLSATEICRILHISKRKCAWMMQNGMIPCKDTGKKTRRYVVLRTDLDAYVKDSTEHPEKYFIPVTFSADKPCKRARDKYFLHPNQVPEDFRAWLDDQWYDLPDVITPKDVETILGYEHDTVRRWLNRGWLKIIKAHNAELVPREWLIDFTCDYAFRIIKKSPLHRELLDKYFGN